MMKGKLTLREYWDHVGTANMMKVIDEVGSSFGHFRSLKYGIKRPGAIMAISIIEAAKKITPGWAPDLEAMVRGAPTPALKRRGRTTPPSEDYIRSLSRRTKKKEPVE